MMNGETFTMANIIVITVYYTLAICMLAISTTYFANGHRILSFNYIVAMFCYLTLAASYYHLDG